MTSRRRHTVITIADEAEIRFLALDPDGEASTLAHLPLEAFLEDASAVANLPSALGPSANRLLIVPDYWIGNHFQEFQSRKPGVIAALIQRRLRQMHPDLTDAADFYAYALTEGQGQKQHLVTFFFQEKLAFQVHARLDRLGLGPLRITTPALVWQDRLAAAEADFRDRGVGFIHLGEADCFLYFYFMGQFLFSRHIQLDESPVEGSDDVNRLSYEINQSFYLYSQKTKQSVDRLVMAADKPSVMAVLSDVMERPIVGLPQPANDRTDLAAAGAPPACRGFNAQDIGHPHGQSIYYQPLKHELEWRPVQWAGMAVGLLLAVLLVVEAGYLHVMTGVLDRRIHHLASANAEAPDAILADMTLALDEINRELARPSGSGTMVRTLLAVPEGVTLQKLALQVAQPSRLAIDALLDTDNPDVVKRQLAALVRELNRRFALPPRALEEKDVHIQLVPHSDTTNQTACLMTLEIELP